MRRIFFHIKTKNAKICHENLLLLLNKEEKKKKNKLVTAGFEPRPPGWKARL